MSNRKRDQKIVEEILGFQPLVFYRDINEAVISDLEQGMNSFRKELTTIAKTKGIKVQEKDLDIACSKLSDKLKQSLSKNFETFELYVNRNIFKLPEPKSEIVIESSENSTANQEYLLEELNKEIDILKKRYLQVFSEHQQLLYECSDMDLLLKDMRSALFHLRVGAQVLESNNESLEDTIQSMVKEKAILKELSSRAEELDQELRAKIQLPVTEARAKTSRKADDVKLGSLEEIKLLNKALQSNSKNH